MYKFHIFFLTLNVVIKANEIDNYISECFNKSLFVNEYMRLEAAEHWQYAVGITSDCLVFNGWYSSGLSHESKLPQLPNKKGECDNHQVFLLNVREEIDNEIHKFKISQMIIAVRLVGPRIEIQNAVSGKLVHFTKNMVWHSLSMNRRERFFTPAAPIGYTLVNCFSLLSRVFVLARNHYHYKIFELKLIVRRNNELDAYLSSTRLVINPIIYPPRKNIIAMPLDSWKNPNILFIGFFPKTKPEGNRQRTGAAISLNNLYTSNSNFEYEASLTIPDSLIGTNRYHNIHSCANISYYWLYPMKMDTVEKYAFEELDPPHALNKNLEFIQRKFFNNKNTHRRMAYPFVRYNRSQRKLRSEGWLKLLPTFCGVTVGMIGVASVAKWICSHFN